MHYYLTKLCKRVFILLTLTLVSLQIVGCGQSGALTMPEQKSTAEPTESVEDDELKPLTDKLTNL
jgi:predicted small lipoprotein YifL